MKHTTKMHIGKDWGVSGTPHGAGRSCSIPHGIAALAQT